MRLAANDLEVREGCWGFIGNDASNNCAEYLGLLASVRRAVQRLHQARLVAFQVDSVLVARQVNMQWACRCPEFAPLLATSLEELTELERSGLQVVVEHIYRQCNRIAEKQANYSATTRSSCSWVPANEVDEDSQRERMRRKRSETQPTSSLRKP